MDNTQKQIVRTVTGLALGVVCGWLMYRFMDGNMVARVNESVLVPVRDVFLSALKMMMAPVTFFAILAGVINVRDSGMLAKMGGNMVTVSLFMQVLVAFLALMFAAVIFSGDLTYMQAGIVPADKAMTATQQPSLTDLLFNIVPSNIIDPFRGGNILQVMFMAIFFGIILNKIGVPEKVRKAVNFAFNFSIAAMKVIVYTIPVMVFLSMASLISHTGMESLLELSGLFGGLFVGVLIVWIVGMLTVLLFCRISPLQLIRKLASISPFVFSVSSSHARLPFVLNFCSEKLGIDPQLASFSIPVGVQLYKAGNCVFFSLMTMLMMSIYGIELTPQLFATLLVSVCIMSIAKPPVPCGGIICMAYLLSMVGVPAEAISVVVCIDPLAAMFNGVCNESANITTSFVLAKSYKKLNEEVYKPVMVQK